MSLSTRRKAGLKRAGLPLRFPNARSAQLGDHHGSPAPRRRARPGSAGGTIASASPHLPGEGALPHSPGSGGGEREAGLRSEPLGDPRSACEPSPGRSCRRKLKATPRGQQRIRLGAGRPAETGAGGRGERG